MLLLIDNLEQVGRGRGGDGDFSACTLLAASSLNSEHFGVKPPRGSETAPAARRVRTQPSGMITLPNVFWGFRFCIISAVSISAAEPEPLALMPGPARTE